MGARIRRRRSATPTRIVGYTLTMATHETLLKSYSMRVATYDRNGERYHAEIIPLTYLARMLTAADRKMLVSSSEFQKITLLKVIKEVNNIEHKDLHLLYWFIYKR